MEENIGDETKCNLEKIKDMWFLNVGGRRKKLTFINNATRVSLECNVIFADERHYQVIVESNGKIMIEEIEDIDVKECKLGNTVIESEEVGAKAKDDSEVILREPQNRKPDKGATRVTQILVECAGISLFKLPSSKSFEF